MKAKLVINLAAIGQNYQRIIQMAQPAMVAAVVKADAYGLGIHKIAPYLYLQGCRHFFVATVDEGITLRNLVENDVQIYILYGPSPKNFSFFQSHQLIPVLNTMGQIKLWKNWLQDQPIKPKAVIHIDSGINRLGFVQEQLTEIKAHLTFPVALFLSHLASADEPHNPSNTDQLKIFKNCKEQFKSHSTQFSLAASSGIFLGKSYHFDMVRSGIALWGGNPTPAKPNPMLPVISLKIPVIQIRTIRAGSKVGYNGTYQYPHAGRFATIAAGYADGILRSLSNKGQVRFKDFKLPIIGRISMDLMTIDITSLPEHLMQEGDEVELIGSHQPIDDVASFAGTISYEMLTSLGNRYQREYIG